MILLFLAAISLFIDETKLTPEACKHLQIDITMNHQSAGLTIEMRPYKMIKEFLKWLISQQSGKIWVSQRGLAWYRTWHGYTLRLMVAKW